MQTWEYAVVNYTISERWSAPRQKEEIQAFRAKLNEGGSEGWELVNYVPVPVTGNWSNKVKNYAYLMIFKRPLEG